VTQVFSLEMHHFSTPKMLTSFATIHLTLLIVVSFSHEVDLVLTEEEGFLLLFRIFAECPCQKFPDSPRYYVNFD
jgi:hypothetical protein